MFYLDLKLHQYTVLLLTKLRKLVNFSVSSNSHPERVNISNTWTVRVNISNTWTVRNLIIQTRKMDTKNIAAKYPYLTYIAIDTQTPSEISILIRADQLHLHFYTEVRNPSESVTLQATLRWVIMGGNNRSSFSANKMTRNSDIDNTVQRFWILESYSTTEILNL